MKANKNPFKSDTMYLALVDSPEWRAWEAFAYDQGFAWAETFETGLMSTKHMTAFLEFVRGTHREIITEQTETVNIVSNTSKKSK